VNCLIRVDTDQAGGSLECRAITPHRHYGFVDAIGVRAAEGAFNKKKNRRPGLDFSGSQKPSVASRFQSGFLFLA
jgi:hypothetical protein